MSTRIKQDIIRGKDVNLAACKKKIKLDEFILAFPVYRSIICDTFPQRRSELDAYCNIIILMATKFRGTGFYDYHKAFSAKAAALPCLLLNQNIKLDWSLRDYGLSATLLVKG